MKKILLLKTELEVFNKELGGILVKAFENTNDGSNVTVVVNEDGSATVSFVEQANDVLAAVQDYFVALFASVGITIGTIAVTANADGTITVSF